MSPGTAFRHAEGAAAGGRFTSSGAIAGPIVDLDMRDMYLKDISLIGTTAWDEPVFPNLIRYIEAGEIRPLLAATWPLGEIAAAQKAFAKGLRWQFRADPARRRRSAPTNIPG